MVPEVAPSLGRSTALEQQLALLSVCLDGCDLVLVPTPSTEQCQYPLTQRCYAEVYGNATAKAHWIYLLHGFLVSHSNTTLHICTRRSGHELVFAFLSSQINNSNIHPVWLLWLTYWPWIHRGNTAEHWLACPAGVPAWMGLLSSQTCGRQGDGEESGQSPVNCAECRYGMAWDELQLQFIIWATWTGMWTHVPVYCWCKPCLFNPPKVGVLIWGRQETHG